AEIQGGAQNKEKPAPDAGEKKKGNRGIPRGTEQRNSAGLKTREQNEEHRHSMPGNRHTKRPASDAGEKKKGMSITSCTG
ncbi:MAG: hypothetical protein SPF23_03815, partial [Paludibacteraceae bacterium]|nr:hypothetical protein [Paludibacteraceae bacterium]